LSGGECVRRGGVGSAGEVMAYVGVRAAARRGVGGAEGRGGASTARSAARSPRNRPSVPGATQRAARGRWGTAKATRRERERAVLEFLRAGEGRPAGFVQVKGCLTELTLKTESESSLLRRGLGWSCLRLRSNMRQTG
jgi:hypothetical protein